MSNEIAIKVEDVTKIYKLYDSPTDRLKEALNPFRKKYHRDFHAIDGVSLEIMKGETVGIIGQNGAGKSTLLKMITGVLTPSSGKIQVKGRISALLELGAGFNPDVSGLENVYFNGTLMGFTKEELDAKIDDVLAFADIGAFIHQPVKIYSSGMFVRLAFAMAVHVAPEILIVDEALSVGDTMFQSKCFEKIKSLMEGGATTLFVTHNVNAINTFCNRAIMLDGGKVFSQGPPQSITLQYYEMIREKDHLSQNFKKSVKKIAGEEITESTRKINLLKGNTSCISKYGVGVATIKGCFLLNSEATETTLIRCGESFAVILNIQFNDDIDNPCYGFSISNPMGIVLLSSHTYHDRTLSFDKRAKGDVIEVELKTSMLLNPGKFLLSIGVGEHRSAKDFTNFDVVKNICEIEVYGKSSYHGIIHHDSAIRVSLKGSADA